MGQTLVTKMAQYQSMRSFQNIQKESQGKSSTCKRWEHEIWCALENLQKMLVQILIAKIWMIQTLNSCPVWTAVYRTCLCWEILVPWFHLRLRWQVDCNRSQRLKNLSVPIHLRAAQFFSCFHLETWLTLHVQFSWMYFHEKRINLNREHNMSQKTHRSKTLWCTTRRGVGGGRSLFVPVGW